VTLEIIAIQKRIVHTIAIRTGPVLMVNVYALEANSSLQLA